MRMWLCDPEILCQKHLCGEHLEMHMFLGTLVQGKKIDGYLKNNLFEPLALYTRHDELAAEMIKRGYKHKSEMDSPGLPITVLPEEKKIYKINREMALRDLLSRCPECQKRFSSLY